MAELTLIEAIETVGGGLTTLSTSLKSKIATLPKWRDWEIPSQTLKIKGGNVIGNAIEIEFDYRFLDTEPTMNYEIAFAFGGLLRKIAISAKEVSLREKDDGFMLIAQLDDAVYATWTLYGASSSVAIVSKNTYAPSNLESLGIRSEYSIPEGTAFEKDITDSPMIFVRKWQ